MDMRRGHDGLFEIVRGWGLNAFGGDLFAFVGKRRDRLKILVWHRGGFVLIYKRRPALWSPPEPPGDS